MTLNKTTPYANNYQTHRIFFFCHPLSNNNEYPPYTLKVTTLFTHYLSYSPLTNPLSRRPLLLGVATLTISNQTTLLHIFWHSHSTFFDTNPFSYFKVSHEVVTRLGVTLVTRLRLLPNPSLIPPLFPTSYGLYCWQTYPTTYVPLLHFTSIV